MAGTPSTAAQTCAAALAERVSVIHTSHSIAVGLRDFDLVMLRHRDLKGLVTFLDAKGNTIDSFQIDWSHEATRSHVVFGKDGQADYARVAMQLTSNGRRVLDRAFDVPPPVVSAVRAKVVDEVADLMPGTAFEDGATPAIKLLDYERVPNVSLQQPSRSIDIESCKKRVVADLNFPSVSSMTFVAGQTAFPDDPAKKSIYIPANSDLYDPQTGAYDSTMKYLVEIPVDPEWVTQEGDKVVQVAGDGLRIHMTTDEIDVRRLGVQRITGNRKGLLGQCINSYGVAEDGNIYFSMQYRSPIRFNVKKAKWEAPPVNIYDFHLQHKPKIEDLPYEEGAIQAVRTDFSNVILCHNRRVWVSTARYAMFSMGTGSSLCLASVISIPMDHWDDKDAFEKAMRFNAGSFPEAPFPLWSTHVSKNDHQRKLNVMMALDHRHCLLAYHYNRFWVMDVADDGSTQKLVPVETLGGKRIVRFSHNAKWAMRGDEALGLILEVTLEEEKKPRRAFLPMDSYELAEQLPQKIRTPPFHFQKGGVLHNPERGYGKLTVNKYNLAALIGKPWIKGRLTIFYDAVARMRANLGPHKDVIDSMSAASMGPEYYLVSAPGKTMEIVGTSDYPMYNFARYDCSSGAERVQKTFLTQDLGDIDVQLSIPAGLGLYCHQWFREGNDDVLYYAGYTGVARLRYRVDGRVPPRHKVEKLFHGQAKHLCLDAAPNAYIKWYRDIRPGLGDKVFLTGLNIAQRGGTAYSGGLMYFHRRTPNRLHKLSKMSRCYKTKRLATRLRGAPGGRLEQDVLLAGNFDARDAETIPEQDRPTNVQPRVFVYADRGASGVHDLFGLTLSSGAAQEAGLEDLAVSQNGLYLLLCMKDGTLATLDLGAWRFVDAVRLPNPSGLLRAPNGRCLAAISEPLAEGGDDAEEPPKRTWKTYVMVDIDGRGSISLSPHLRLTFDREHRFGRSTWLYDHEKDDGSYDLVIGPNSRKPEGSITIVRDFLPPRALP